MARCRKCDRCGKYYEPKGGITNNVGTTTFNNDNEETTSVVWYDLCPECAAGFHNWFGTPKRTGTEHGVHAIDPSEAWDL